jgi:transposase InsO family protein
MIALLSLFLHILVAPFKSQARVEAEISVLRHQLNVLRRQTPSKPRLTAGDRLIFVWLYRLFPSVLSAISVIEPETVVRWNRMGFRLYWRWKSRSRGGRPRIPAEIRRLIRDSRLIRDMSLANRLLGAPRIHGELVKLGIEVAQSTVAKYMAKRGRGRSQTWKTFLHNHAAGIGAMDFLIVPKVGFRLLFVLVILRHQRRRLISLTVTANPTAEWIALQITNAFPWDEAPDYLIRDRDGSYGHAVTRRLATVGIRDHPTAPRSPWQNGHAERLIGSIRRECLDHIVVFGDAHLRRILGAYIGYYNEHRTHLSLDKDSPNRRPVQQLGHVTAADSRRTSSSILLDVVFGRHRSGKCRKWRLLSVQPRPRSACPTMACRPS